MTIRSSFAPRDLLEHTDDFGTEADVVWRYAISLDEAMRLSRSIDQHVRALGVTRLLRRGRHSMSDLAGVLGERPETLADKLRGRAPAPDGDLVLWSWITGTARVHRPLDELVQLPNGASADSVLPVLGVPARQSRALKDPKRARF